MAATKTELKKRLEKLESQFAPPAPKEIAAYLPKNNRDRAVGDDPLVDTGEGVLLYDSSHDWGDLTEEGIIAPQAKQEFFLAEDSDIALYGGSAGAGKSQALLMQPLIHISDPNFAAVLLRRTNPEIEKAGGLLPESGELYPPLEAKLNKSRPTHWKFPSGATISFDHLQYDSTAYRYQGSQIPLICFDEASHFSWFQVSYLMSRNRSARSRVNPYIRMASNPDPDSFLLDLVGPYLDSQGYPDQSMARSRRWFVNDKGSLVWADKKEDLERKYKSTQLDPKSFTFHPASLEDNPILAENDPNYRGNLLALPEVEQERLLKGNWFIRDEAGKVFNEDWFEIVTEGAIPNEGRLIRGWDLAATEKKMTNKEPSATASVLIKSAIIRGQQIFYILDATEDYLSPVDADQKIRELAIADRKLPNNKGYGVRWELEGGSSGKRDARHLSSLLEGFDAKGVRPAGDKVVRAKPFAAAAYQGRVKLLSAPWNQLFLQRYHSFPDSEKKDLVDAGSVAFSESKAQGAQKLVKVR